jgi:hypothetical protein
VPSLVRAPRTVLPSTASTTRSSGRRAASCALTHAPSARSSAAGSTAVSTRQIVTRSGTVRPSPRLARSRGGASAAHSAIAAYDRAPASTAHTAMASTGTSRYRRPRGSLGSGTCPRASSRPPGAVTATAGPRRLSAASWPPASTVGEDDMAGMAPGDDHEVWRPHDRRYAVPASLSPRSRRAGLILPGQDAITARLAQVGAHVGWFGDGLRAWRRSPGRFGGGHSVGAGAADRFVQHAALGFSAPGSARQCRAPLRFACGRRLSYRCLWCPASPRCRGRPGHSRRSASRTGSRPAARRGR